ncbi:primosomal replication protein [Vibrio cholerae]
MVGGMMESYSKFHTILNDLKHSAAQLDRQRGEHHRPLFDEVLFHCHGKLLTPCVEEAHSTLQALIREKESGRLTALRAEYLSERLLAQIAALTRELSTQTVRRNEPKPHAYFKKPINELYQELAQHQDWERRLMDLVRDKSLLLEQASATEKAAAQQALLQSEQRLNRCREAKIKIEKRITTQERKA